MCLFAVAILASGIATADTIEVTGVGTGDGTENGNDLYIDENGTNTEIYFAGNIDISVTDSAGTFPRSSMCVELFTDIDLNSTYNTTVYVPSAFNPPTGPELKQIAYLLDTYDPVTGNTLTDDQAAGLQLAIWKIAEDGVDTGSNLSWTTGTVQEGPDPNQTTQNVYGFATTYLADAVGHSSNIAFVYYNTESNGTAVQMLEGPEYATGPQGKTPESSTFMLAGVALLALGHTAKRKLGSR
jgi:hypothetical protein